MCIGLTKAQVNEKPTECLNAQVIMTTDLFPYLSPTFHPSSFIKENVFSLISFLSQTLCIMYPREAHPLTGRMKVFTDGTKR